MTRHQPYQRLLTILVALLLASTACNGATSKPKGTVVKQAQTNDPQVRAEQLAAMSKADCEKIDAYDFIQPPEPRVMPTGASFHYSCEWGSGGWYFDGAPGDRWSARSIDDAIFPQGENVVRLPIEWVNPPWDHHHPAHLNSLTLIEIREDMSACIHDVDGVTFPVRIVGPPYAQIHATKSGKVGNMLLDYAYLSDGMGETASLMDLGILPAGNGWWSEIYMTHSC